MVPDNDSPELDETQEVNNNTGDNSETENPTPNPGDQTGESTGEEGDSSYVSPIAYDWEMWEKLLALDRQLPYDARQYAIDQALDSFLEGMKEDPAYQADATVEGTVTPMVIDRKSSLECSVKAAPGTDLYIGDMVECFDEDWIVVDLYADKLGIINAKLWICNDIIKFQNHSPVVYTRHCVVDDGSYSRRSTDPYAYVPTNTYKIYISLEAASRQLYIDKRLGLGPIYDSEGNLILEVYKITGIDIKSKNRGEGSHLMVLTVQRDVYNPSNDSLALNLCDVYYSLSEEGSGDEPETSGSAFIQGRDFIRIGTSSKYEGRFEDESGASVVPQGEIVWTITSSDNSITWTISNGIVTVKAPFKDDLVGAEVTMKLSDSNQSFATYEKKVRVISIG